MSKDAFCKCENEECERRKSCARFLSEHDTVINYPLISERRDMCTWYERDRSVEVGDE